MDRVHKTIDGIRYTITRQQVLAELVHYDAEFPGNDYGERAGGPGWLESAQYHYALVHEGRLYPPKALLHRITGAGLDRFTGGEFTNGVFRRLGFEILDKDAALARIRVVEARSARAGKGTTKDTKGTEEGQGPIPLQGEGIRSAASPARADAPSALPRRGWIVGGTDVLDVANLLSEMAAQRPLFHSEADFQHALAWEIQRRTPEASIRLELPVRYASTVFYVDIWAKRGNHATFIELKYKTRRLSLVLDGERFELKDQSAQDLGRYDFVKDIRRLEQIVRGCRDASGWAVLLTNDSAYWSAPASRRTVDASFRLHEGHTLQGTLAWGAGASAGTIRGREQDLQLSGAYRLQWRQYSKPVAGSYGTFRYLAIEVQ